MTHFYFSTGRTDKHIKNKLWISEGLKKEIESICINNSYYDTERCILIKSFDTEFKFKDISELIETLKKVESEAKNENN